MLLVVLCHACLLGRPVDPLTPYFDGATPPDALTSDSPCPRSTQVRSNSELGARCGVEDRPDDELVVEFFKDGLLAGYSTTIEGVSHGVQRTWHPNGVARETTTWRAGKQHGAHTVSSPAGAIELQESYVDGVRDGRYTRWLDRTRSDNGMYIRGLKEGMWTEHLEGRQVSGEYRFGKRTGEWAVRGAVPAIRSTSFVQFTDGKPTFAEEFGGEYQALIGVADALWIGLAVYGHVKGDNRIKAAGAIGLVASGPVIHAWQQAPRNRGEVVQKSLLDRPLSVIGVLALYTIGKYFAGLECKSGDDLEGGTSSCATVESHFNRDYNWNGVLVATAISVVGLDIARAVKRRPAALERAWPQLGPMPVAKGGGLSLSARF